MITIATFNNSIEASLAQQLLEDQGITVFLKDEATVNIAWHLTLTMGGIKLQVEEKDAQLARTILEEYQSSLPLEETEYDESENQEDQQQSNSDRQLNQALKVAVIGLLFLPLQLYSLWILVTLLLSGVKLKPRQQLKAVIILGINLAVIIVILNLIF